MDNSNDKNIKKFQFVNFESPNKKPKEFKSQLSVDESSLTYSRPKKSGFTEFGAPVEEPTIYTQSQFDKAKQDIYQQAYKEGFEKASKDAEQTVIKQQENTNMTASQVLNALQSSLSELEEYKRSYRIKMAELLRHSVERFCHAKFDDQVSEIFLKTIESCSLPLDERLSFKVKLNPEIEPDLSPKLKKHFETLGDAIVTEILPDNAVAKTECIIEWGNTGINIDLKEKMKEIDNILAEFIKSI
jgi:flagellar biosynthesis/type III secretory pathway protein FliH